MLAYNALTQISGRQRLQRCKDFPGVGGKLSIGHANPPGSRRMMLRLRRHSAYWLLTLMVVGGLVLPEVHRFQHGVEHQHDRRAAGAQAASPQQDHASIGIAPSDGTVHDLICVLCKNVTERSVLSASDDSPPRLRESISHEGVASIHLSEQTLSHLSRGPPLTC